VDHERQFGVQVCGTRVEVQRADHDDLPVDHVRLRMQARTRTRAEQPRRRLFGLRLEFVQLDAALQQRHAVRRVAGLHRDRVGGRERFVTIATRTPRAAVSPRIFTPASCGTKYGEKARNSARCA
jgi:hypothetical protein